MTTTKDLYLTPVELYRLGNATTPRLDQVRIPRDMPTQELNGFLYVTAGNFGISLLDALGLSKTRMDGWVWRIKKGTVLPIELRLIQNHEGHYLLVPSGFMLLDEFRAALARLATRCERTAKVVEIQTR